MLVIKIARKLLPKEKKKRIPETEPVRILKHFLFFKCSLVYVRVQATEAIGSVAQVTTPTAESLDPLLVPHLA